MWKHFKMETTCYSFLGFLHLHIYTHRWHAGTCLSAVLVLHLCHRSAHIPYQTPCSFHSASEPGCFFPWESWWRFGPRLGFLASDRGARSNAACSAQVAAHLVLFCTSVTFWAFCSCGFLMTAAFFALQYVYF